jgi:hypothetical protein
MRVSIDIPRERLAGMGIPDVQRVYADMAERMAGQYMGSLFRAVGEACAAGQTAIDAKGGKFSFDLFLEVLAKMQLEFDERGKWIPPTLVMNPKMAAAVKEEALQWEKDPVYMDRLRRLLARKHEEWRERESRRKLVD